MRHWVLKVALPVLLLLASTARADTAREQLDRFAQGLESLRAEFSQVVISTDNTVQDRSEGQVWLLQPNRFRWSYGGDFPELVVGDGERFWIHDEMLEQVTVKPHDDDSLDSPLALLTQPNRIDEAFEVREVGSWDEAQLLELRSRSGDTQFERFLLGFDNDEPVLIVIEDAFGLRTEIRFSSLERNPELDAALFTFTPPEGTDVIGTLPGDDESR
ncbi:MAG: outer membrane lipoprotein chaperone LolA [Gammaproteobacteria bacterium]|nr:outer membrane lipoprotein chaperone LolA [Gammaproteobacteria bacterium]